MWRLATVPTPTYCKQRAKNLLVVEGPYQMLGAKLVEDF